MAEFFGKIGQGVGPIFHAASRSRSGWQKFLSILCLIGANNKQTRSKQTSNKHQTNKAEKQMDKKQIEEDIAQWFRERLKRAVLDSFERFEIMGIASHDAAAQIASELVILSARMLGEASVATPEMCGKMFAQSIERYRKRKAKEASND